jgi:hypothetical protein
MLSKNTVIHHLDLQELSTNQIVFLKEGNATLMQDANTL